MHMWDLLSLCACEVKFGKKGLVDLFYKFTFQTTLVNGVKPSSSHFCLQRLGLVWEGGGVAAANMLPAVPSPSGDWLDS